MGEKYLTIPTGWFTLNLTSREMFVLSEIVNITNYYGKCVANNRHFGELLGMNKVHVSRSLNSLKEKGFISMNIKVGSRNHDREITITKMIRGGYQNDAEGLPKSLETKDINNIINNILSFLNGLLDKSYRSTEKTKVLIKARLNEGFSEDDFKYVIKVKSEEWKHDDKMCKYLRPETLFGTKFEGYLNQNDKTEKEDWRKYAR